MTARRILTEKRHLIWPIVAGLLINAGVYLFVVYPLAQKVAGGEESARSATAALTAARAEHNNAREMVKGKADADQELQKFYGDVLPPDLSGARRITFPVIDQMAKSGNVRLDRVTLDPKPIRDSALTKLTYSAVISGEYRDIRKFIHALETAPEFLVLENVELTQGEGEARGITMNLQIATYFRTEAHGN